jgi:peptidoglycan/LPS O-acetylase OafA/YrhL
VAAVLCFHTGANWAVGGYIGVDVFFVLSGFLITTLLLREYERQKHIALGRFYARRALRLLPAVFAVCAFVLIHGPQLPGAVNVRGLHNGVIGTVFYFSNWQAAFNLLPLYTLTEHTWSLAIEEQFYLFWPPILALLLWRRFGERKLLTVLAVLALGSAIWRGVLWSGGASQFRVYYGSDVRADALLIGCALAVLRYYGRLPSRISRAALPAGATLVAFVVLVRLSDGWLYYGGLTLAALATAFLIAALVVAPDSAAGRLLSLSALRGLGRISYGLYLWHWPVFLILNPGELGLAWLPAQVVRISVSIAVAIASYFLIERPFLRLRHRFDPGRPIGAQQLRRSRAA